jgi:hypothetical protein
VRKFKCKASYGAETSRGAKQLTFLRRDQESLFLGILLINYEAMSG